MLNELRLYFKVTMAVLANYLEVSYDMVKSLSASRRAYSLEGINKLLVLYKALELKKEWTELPYATSFLALEKELAMEPLQELIKKTEKHLLVRQASLQTLQIKRQAWLRGIHACSVLLKDNSLSVKDVTWIGSRKKHLEAQLAENPYFRELQLLTEVHGLEKQLEDLFRQAQ